MTYTISLALCGHLLLTGAAQASPDCAKVKGTGNTAAIAQSVFQ